MADQSVELRVVVKWNDEIAKKLKRTAVPGLAEAFLNQGFPDAFASVEPVDPDLRFEPVAHGPSCICGCQKAVYAEVLTP